MKILIVGSSKLPVPAIKGGAVPNLIEELIQENEIKKNVDLYCCSIWDKDAEYESYKYKSSKFIWVKIPKVIKLLDIFLYHIFKDIFRIQRLLSIRFFFQIIWYTFVVAILISNKKFDKIIFENSVPVLFSLKLFNNKHRYKNKYYVHMHSVPRKYYGNLNVFRNCKKLICVSNFVAGEILKHEKLKLDKKKVNIMYNCIDTQLIRPLGEKETVKLREKYGIPENKKIILFVGRLCKEKGIEEVIHAVNSLDKKEFVLLIVGSNFYNSGIISSYEEKIKKLCETIKENIYFTGYIDYIDMVYFYNLANVVVLPSMWDEPAGMTIIEAMACKKTIITTKSGGIPEYVGINNCILLERDARIVESIAFYIKKLLQDKEYCNSIAERAYQRAIKYNKSFYYQQFLKLIED